MSTYTIDFVMIAHDPQLPGFEALAEGGKIGLLIRAGEQEVIFTLGETPEQVHEIANGLHGSELEGETLEEAVGAEIALLTQTNEGETA